MNPALSELPTLTTQRLRIRWLTPDDVPALYAIFRDPEVTRYWSQPPMRDEAAAEQMLVSVREFLEAGTLYQWGIERQDANGVIGTCTLAAIDLRNQRAELGYALHRDHWGCGYATEALTRLLAWGFTTLRLNRVEADVDPNNERSIRVLERLGFLREGFLRERWIVNGLIQDTAMFGLLRREWTGGDDAGPAAAGDSSPSEAARGHRRHSPPASWGRGPAS